jgi:hypothetical protein
MSTVGVQGRTESWEAPEWDQQFVPNQRTNMLLSQRLLMEGNAHISMVPDMQHGLAKTIEKVCISRDFERPEID